MPITVESGYDSGVKLRNEVAVIFKFIRKWATQLGLLLVYMLYILYGFIRGK